MVDCSNNKLERVHNAFDSGQQQMRQDFQQQLEV